MKNCAHQLSVLPEGRRGKLAEYKYWCLACGKYLKIHSGVIVARTVKEEKAWFKKKAGEL